MNSREIVTLQFGHYANFVGTHWWNLQCEAYSFKNSSLGGNFDKPTSEIDFDSTFREGITRNNEVTYTPRAIFYDLKDSLRTLKQTGTLYDLEDTNLFLNSWNTSPSIHQQEAYEKNKYLKSLDEEEEPQKKPSHLSSKEKKDGDQEKDLKLETSVQVWSDFLKQHLHPKTVETINSGAGSFDLFGLGVEEYKKQQDEMEERLHFFTEECDSLQGFQILLDPTDAFSGLSSSFYQDYVLDEFGNKAHVLINLFPSKSQTTKDLNLLSACNLMLTYNHFKPATSIIPLSSQTKFKYKPPFSSHRDLHSFPYDASLSYHTSAILAIAFNNITLPYRDFKRDTDMKTFYSSLIFDSRNILAAQLSYPFRFENSLYKTLEHMKNPSKHPAATIPHVTTLTSSVSDQISTNLQHVSISGLSKEQVFGKQTQSQCFKELDLINDFLYTHFNTSHHKTFTSLYKTPLITADPFPSFTPSPHRNNLTTTPILTSLQNTSDISDHLKDVMEALDQVKTHQLRRYVGDFIEKDDFTDKLEHFRVDHDRYIE